MDGGEMDDTILKFYKNDGTKTKQGYDEFICGIYEAKALEEYNSWIS